MVLVDVAVGELLPAQLTFVRFVFAVNDLVRCNLVQTFERAVADLAGIRPLLCTAPHVRGCGYIKKPASPSTSFLPECVIMWRFS